MDKLLERSVEYEELVFGMLTLSPYDNSKRIQLSHTMCAVSIEHSESLKILLESGNFTSSIGLLRLQFEALVRAIWILYSASDSVVEKLSLDLNDSIPRTNERLPMLSEMLKSLEEKAPENALKPLSSFVHGGIHAITRHSKGYPPAILEQALLASNGVNGMSGYFLAILTGNPATVKDFYQSYSEFSDCLPSIKP